MTLKYLITGATGGLGSDVLAHLVANLPSSEYAAASSSEANRERFEKEGIAFRVTNFDDPLSLDIAFEDVENLFFVSTNVFDTERRSKQHQNVVDAAKRKGVRHVCTSFDIHMFLRGHRRNRVLTVFLGYRFGIHLWPLAGYVPTRRSTCNKLIYKLSAC
jgi:NADPH:quinone reductase-like Zn-dependent oxidoreductase